MNIDFIQAISKNEWFKSLLPQGEDLDDGGFNILTDLIYEEKK